MLQYTQKAEGGVWLSQIFGLLKGGLWKWLMKQVDNFSSVPPTPL